MFSNTNTKDILIKNGTNPNITEKSAVWKRYNINKMPIVKAKSLIRLTTKALIAALFACIRVNQKLINR